MHQRRGLCHADLISRISFFGGNGAVINAMIFDISITRARHSTFFFFILFRLCVEPKLLALMAARKLFNKNTYIHTCI